MPKKVEVTVEQFAQFDRAMLELGYARLTPEEVRCERERLGLVSRRRKKQKGQEVGYVFSAHGLKVKVWTTWLKDEGAFRKEDQGWVLVASGDRAIHYQHPFNRTKKFLRRLYNYARAEQQRILRRPTCPHCKTSMRVVQGPGLKERGWACQNIHNHPGQTYEVVEWNARLDPAVAKYLARYERRERAYRLKREEAGKPNFVAMLRRKGSVVTRHENFVE